MVDFHRNVKWFAKHDIVFGGKKEKKVRIRIAVWI